MPELLESHDTELTAQNLIKLENQFIEEEEELSTPSPRLSQRKACQKVLRKYSKH